MEVDDDTFQPIERTQESVVPVVPPSPLPPPSPEPQSQSEPAQPATEASSSVPIVISTQEDESPAVQSTNEAIVIDSPPESVAAAAVVVAEAVSVSAALADTTTATIVIDNESQDVDDSCEAAQSQTKRDEPIELTSSPSSDVDAKDQQQQVTNSQTIISQSDTIVDLDTSSNEADDIKVVSASTPDVCSQRPPVEQPQELDSLDLELINSDSSSHSDNEVQIADIPPPPPPQDVPTSTVESDVVEITDASAPSANVADNAEQTNNTTAAENSVCANDSSQDSVESTNQQKPIGIPENICTITGKNSIYNLIIVGTTIEKKKNALM